MSVILTVPKLMGRYFIFNTIATLVHLVAHVPMGDARDGWLLKETSSTGKVDPVEIYLVGGGFSTPSRVLMTNTKICKKKIIVCI